MKIKMKEKNNKRIPEKVISGLMSGVMLFSATDMAVLGQTLEEGVPTPQNNLIQNGVVRTAELVAPTMRTRTDTTITLNTVSGTKYALVDSEKAAKEWTWAVADGESKVFDELTAATAYTFAATNEEDTSGIAEGQYSVSETIYTLQEAPKNVESTATLNFPEETIQINASLEMNTAQDFSGTPIKSGDKISDKIGGSIYVRATATGALPHGVSAEYKIKERAENKVSVPLDQITRTTSGFSFTPVAGGIYQYTGGSVITPLTISAGKVTGLLPGTAYKLISYKAATADSFASGTSTQTVRTKSVVAAPSKDGEGQSVGGNTITRDITEADLGSMITYTVTYAEGYTPSLSIGKTEIPFSEAISVIGKERTVQFHYTIGAEDTTVSATAHFKTRSVKSVASPAQKTAYANDAANTSEAALAASLPKQVKVTYDNGTTGDQGVTWQRDKTAAAWDIKGGNYTYKAELGNKVTATQTVKINPVYASFDALEDIKKPVKTGGYDAAALGLKEALTVTYSASGMEPIIDEAVSVSWSPLVPANFGAVQADTETFTGTLSIPEWATVGGGKTVSTTVTFGIPLTIEGLTLYAREYDGTNIADSNIIDFAKFKLKSGGTTFSGCTLAQSGEDLPIVRLDGSDVGQHKVVAIENLKLIGADADKYVLDFGNITSTEITRLESLDAPESAPTVEVRSITDTSVTLEAVENDSPVELEYGYSTDENTVPTQWQSNLEFTGLKPGTAYYFFVRYAESSNNVASPWSTASTAYKTQVQVKSPTKAGVGKNDPGCTVTADKEYVVPKADQTVKYTVQASPNYTAKSITVNGETADLTDVQSSASLNAVLLEEPSKLTVEKTTEATATAAAVYTVTYALEGTEQTINAAVTYDARQIESEKATAEAMTLFANDAKNASQQTLEQALPSSHTVVYDNGVEGEEPVQWSFDGESSTAKAWAIKGGTYSYDGKLVRDGNIGVTDLAVTVTPVNATITAIDEKTIAIRANDKPYSMAELGLGSTTAVTYADDTGNLPEIEDAALLNRPVVWNPATPGQFGTEGYNAEDKAAKTFTGTVTLPEWATIEDPIVETIVKTAKAVTVSGVTVTSKTYDGTDTATLDVSNAELVGVTEGETVSYNAEVTAATAHFENANVGSDKKVIVEGGALTGSDADKYVINWNDSVITGTITQATIDAKPTAPTADTQNPATSGKITITAQTVTDETAKKAGAMIEYSNDGVNWQDSPVFEALTPGTSYGFYSRIGATSNTTISPKSDRSSTIRTLAALKAPTLEKEGSCAAVHACSIELYDANQQKINTVLEAAIGTQVTYKIRYCENHHLSFKLGDQIIPLEEQGTMAPAPDELRTWIYSYTVKDSDKTIAATATATERSIKDITAEGISFFANDVRNQSEDALIQSLPKMIPFTYDNGEEGRDTVSSWQLKDGAYDPKGGVLSYEGYLLNNPKVKVTQPVTVKAVTATVTTQLPSLTVKQRPEGYTVEQLEGLPKRANINYTSFVQPQDKDQEIVWEIPEDLGKTVTGETPITIIGTVALPNWATPGGTGNPIETLVDVDARPELALVLDEGAATKVYDGNECLNGITVTLDGDNIDPAHPDVRLESDKATLRFQSPNVGNDLPYTIEDIVLTGNDASWYALKLAGYTDGIITKATIEKQNAPVLAERTANSITLEAVTLTGAAEAAGARVAYSITDGVKTETQMNNPIFTKLNGSPLVPGKEYECYIEAEETQNTDESARSDGLHIRTKMLPAKPIVVKEGSSCADGSPCQIEMFNAAGELITDRSEIGSGETMMFKLKSCEKHTARKLTMNGNDVSLSGSGLERTGYYTVTAKDSALKTAVTFGERASVGIINPETVEIYANDDHNQSADRLKETLAQNVVVRFDNGTTGTEPVSGWKLSSGEWKPTGGTYLYVCSLGDTFVVQTVAVKAVNVSYKAIDNKTLRSSLEGYSKAELGLVERINVTYQSEDGHINETTEADVSWSPEVPVDFGKNAGSQVFTGTIALPEWAGGNKTMTTTVNIVDEQPLKVTGIVLKDKVYDGTTTAVMEGDIYLDTSAIIPGKGSVSLVQKDVSAKFEDAESGSNKVVQIEGLSLEGADAKYYTLDLSGFTATIKKAPVMGIVFESETASFDGEAHGLEATYPENAGITAVYYTYEKDGVILTEAPKEEGVYTVKATFSVDNNHESVAPMTAMLTISNGAKVEAVTITGVPDGTKGCTVTADKELVSKVGEVITYTLKRNVDKYAYVPATFSIGEKAVEMSQLNYDQATHTYTYAYTVESIDKPVTAVVNYVLLGDFSGDGDINIIDAQQVAQYAASGETLTPEQQAAGDVNFDKMINILDAQKIAQFAADSTILF